MFVYVPGTYISPLGLAFEGGVSSNPSSRDRLFLRTAHIPFGSSTRKRCELEPFQQREVIIGDGKSETGHDQVRTWLTRSMLPRQKGRPRVKKRKRTYISSNGKSKRKCWYTYYQVGTYISPFVLALEGGVNSKTKRYNSTTLWLFYLPDFYFANQRSRQCNLSLIHI